MSEYAVMVRGDHLAPAIQHGDMLTVRQQDTAEPGQLAVVLEADGAARVRHYETGTVLGVVTHVAGRRS